ncbi:MAG: O-antigen ligase family protein [Candidatus Omnitrophica bacterium]|nr:O-antigen ligase family protein [Candidatus Omnitrophota bacterium]
MDTRFKRLSERLIEWFMLGVIAVLPFSKTAVEIGLGAALFAWILKKCVCRERLEAPLVFQVLYGLFLLVVFLSIFRVPPQELSLTARGFVRWFKYIGLFFLCLELYKNEASRKRLFVVFIISLAVLSVNGLAQIYRGTDFIKNYSIDIPGRFVRMKSSLQSPNDLATFYLLGLPLAFRAWHEKQKWSRSSFLSFLVLALFFVTFVATLSRSAFFALGAAVCVLALSRGKRTALLAVLVVALCLLFSGTLQRNFFGSFKNMGDRKNGDTTIYQRIQHWKISAAMIREKPFLGQGVNTFTRRFADFAPPEEKYRGYAHNFVLQMWGELGIVGLALFLLPIGIGLIRCRAGGDEDALLIGITAYAIQGLFDTNFYAMQVTILFWIFWGCLQTGHRSSLRSAPG